MSDRNELIKTIKEMTVEIRQLSFQIGLRDGIILNLESLVSFQNTVIADLKEEILGNTTIDLRLIDLQGQVSSQQNGGING